VSGGTHIFRISPSTRIADPPRTLRFSVFPPADYGEWRGRSGIPKSFPPSATSPPSCQGPRKFAAFRGAKEYVRKGVMIKSSNALRHHIVFRTIVQIYLGGSQWQASGLNGPDHLFDQERMIAMAWRHTLRFVVCQLLNQTKITTGHPLSSVMRASVWQAKSSLCTMAPFRPIPIARA
jgi:hypothetical protein